MPELHYHDVTLRYDVVVNPRMTRRIRMRVRHDSVVEVQAPGQCSLQEIEAALKTRIRWLYKRIQAIKSAGNDILPRRYIDGETHLYLGERYPLAIIESHTAPSSVILGEGVITVTLRANDPAAVKRRVQAWYEEQARAYFATRLHAMCDHIAWVKTAPHLRISRMKSQWGSCAPDGTVHLNLHLIRAPKECVDYVIAHELCHLRERNHSKKYYALLQRHYPAWKEDRSRLNAMTQLLMTE